MDEPQRILLIRPSALGDVCRTVPVLVSLRARWPDAQIDWLVQRGFEDAVAAHPALSNILTFDRWRLAPSRLHHRDARAALLALVRELRSGLYDLVIDAQGLLRSSLLALATGARWRVGYANAAELGWIALNRRVRADATHHAVDRMLELLGAVDTPPILDLHLHTAPAWRATAMSLTGDTPYIVLASTSRWPGKRWPDEHFATLATSLLERLGDRSIVLVGGPDEADQCPGLVDLADREHRVTNLIGRTSVGEMMAVIQAADLVVANDSAAVHMAVGFDRPLVALYGPTRVDLVGPYGRSEDVVHASMTPERNRHKHEMYGSALMHSISIDKVLHECTARLARPADARETNK
ncbi:MAG: glycosyltransferase family 9 protein [Planctomycetota bacterium]